MSHPVNDTYLEESYQRAEQAVIENDTDAFTEVYLDLIEKGFDKEAEALREEFGILSVAA